MVVDIPTTWTSPSGGFRLLAHYSPDYNGSAGTIVFPQRDTFVRTRVRPPGRPCTVQRKEHRSDASYPTSSTPGWMERQVRSGTGDERRAATRAVSLGISGAASRRPSLTPASCVRVLARCARGP